MQSDWQVERMTVSKSFLNWQYLPRLAYAKVDFLDGLDRFFRTTVGEGFVARAGLELLKNLILINLN